MTNITTWPSKTFFLVGAPRCGTTSLALALSEQAVKLNGSKDAGMLCTLARAKYENGAHDEAIKIAEDALKNCKDPQVQQELEDNLKTYRGAKGAGSPKGS